MFAEQVDDHLGELARHYSRGDNVAKAAEYLGRAGQQAMQRAAYADAVGSLTAAIDLLQRHPDGPERGQRELLLQLALGPALTVVKGYAAPETERRIFARGSFVSDWATPRSFFAPCMDCGSCTCCVASYGRPMSLPNSSCGGHRACTIRPYRYTGIMR